MRYDLPGPVQSLDPQFATDEYARMIISNIYEGLFARDKDGGLIPGMIESYGLSADKLVYTFRLRGDAVWSNDEPVVADDYVFAFRRMFARSSPSAFAQDYRAIENADEILSGNMPEEKLGVTAVSDFELQIRLAYPSPGFAGLLAETPAMPCNRSFFEESRGRYGLAKNFVNSNGPFYVERWDNKVSIYLRPNADYVSQNPVLSGGVNLYISGEPPLPRLQNGSTDIGVVSFEDAEKLRKQGFSAAEFDSVVWCVVFNQNSPVWGNPLLRQGLARTVDESMLGERLPQRLSPVSLFIPDCMTLAGEAYRPLSGAEPAGFDPERGRRLFEMGLESIGAEKLPVSTFFVPDSAEHLLAMGMVQQGWQKHLSAYISVQPATVANIRERLLSGDYGMLLFPFSPSSPRTESMLSMFRSSSPDNRFGYESSLYDNLLDASASAADLKSSAEYCMRAESLLLYDAVIIPVYTETFTFASAAGISGISPTPFPMRFNFKYAEK